MIAKFFNIYNKRFFNRLCFVKQKNKTNKNEKFL